MGIEEEHAKIVKEIEKNYNSTKWWNSIGNTTKTNKTE